MFFGILPGYCHFITRNTQTCEGSLLSLPLQNGVPSLLQQPSIGYCAATKILWILSSEASALVTETGAAKTGPAVVSQDGGRSVLSCRYRPSCHTALSVCSYMPPTSHCTEASPR